MTVPATVGAANVAPLAIVAVSAPSVSYSAASNAIGDVPVHPVDVTVSAVNVAMRVWKWLVIAAALFRDR